MAADAGIVITGSVGSVAAAPRGDVIDAAYGAADDRRAMAIQTRS